MKTLYTILILLFAVSCNAAEVIKTDDKKVKVSEHYTFTNFTNLQKHGTIIYLGGRVELHIQELLSNNINDIKHILWVTKIQCRKQAQLWWLSKSFELSEEYIQLYKDHADACQYFIQGKITNSQWAREYERIQIEMKILIFNITSFKQLETVMNKQFITKLQPVYNFIIGEAKIHASENTN